MPNLGGIGQGQRELIHRGERTDPRAIIGQAAALAACASFVVLCTLVGVMIAQGYAWRYLRDTWRMWALFSITPWPLAAICAVVALFIEIFDPNWPNPRKAIGSTRPLMPLSPERQQPKTTVRVSLDDLIASLELDGGGDDLD